MLEKVLSEPSLWSLCAESERCIDFPKEIWEYSIYRGVFWISHNRKKLVLSTQAQQWILAKPSSNYITKCHPLHLTHCWKFGQFKIFLLEALQDSLELDILECKFSKIMVWKIFSIVSGVSCKNTHSCFWLMHKQIVDKLFKRID